MNIIIVLDKSVGAVDFCFRQMLSAGMASRYAHTSGGLQRTGRASTDVATGRRT